VSKALTITADPARVSMASAIRATAEAAPLLVLTVRAVRDLVAELGGEEAAVRFLLELAEINDRPIGVNVETGIDRSSTVFIPPRGWTQERLSGWVAAKRDELEAEFGEVVRVGRDLVPAPGRDS
jgi:hypothetical protein